MDKKYELTDETVIRSGHILHRIKALVDIPGTVEAGSIGGWIESEKNLSHKGKCWVHENAVVYDKAVVCGNASVYGHASVFDKAEIYGNTRVYGHAVVCDKAEVYGNAAVFGSAGVHDNASVYGHSKVYEYATVCGNAEVYGYARVCGNASVHGNAEVCEHATVYGKTEVCGNAEVYGNADVHGNVMVYEHAKVCEDARVSGNVILRDTIVRDGKVQKPSDILVIGPLGSRDAYATFNKTSGTVCTGCFKGTIDELEKAVKEKYGDAEYGKDYALFIAFIRAVLANTQAE